MTSQNKIEGVISDFLLDNAFIGYCLTKFELIADDKGMPTMGVTCSHGRVLLYYNPDFVKTLTVPHLSAILIHELLHVLHLHIVRRDYRNKWRWNVACDLSINPLVGLNKLPSWVLQTPEEWHNKTAEWIYERLKSDGKGGNGSGDGDGKGGIKGDLADDHSRWEWGDSKDAVEGLRGSLVEDAVEKSNGSIPGEFQDVVNSILKKKINWKQELRYYLSNKLQLHRTRSWKVRNRRLVSVTPFVFPGSLRRRGLDLIVAVDTSGSISDIELQQFFAEIEYLVRSLHARLLLILCDAKVHFSKEYKKGDWKKIKIIDRGGTDFRPAFEYVKEKKLNPNVLVYLTDAQGNFPDKAPKYDVLWVSTTDGKAPWGKFIRLDMEK